MTASDPDPAAGGLMRARARRPAWAKGRVWAWPSALALLLFVAGRCLVPMEETDLFYNLRLGEIILGTHSVPRTNLLSFTYPDFPDPNLAWLFQIVLALAYRAAGIAGTVILKTAFVVATFALLFRVALHRGAHPAVAAVVLALAAWTAEPRFVERPHLVTFLGLATLLLALERAEQRRTLLMWMMLPLALVWANGNSCFFLAPAVLLLYAAGAALDLRGREARSPARRAAAVALALLPILFATPAGGGWLGYVANHFRMPYLRPLQEYRTVEWPLDAPFFFLLAAAAVGTLTTLTAIGTGTHKDRGVMSEAPEPTPGPPRLRDLLPIIALAALGARRIRFVAEFALLAGPYVAVRGTALLIRVLPRARVARTLRPVGPALVIVGMLLLTFVPRLQSVARGASFFALGIEEGLIPTASIRWLDQHALRDRLYNDLEVGSYLAWDGWPRHRVFQDPRINGYPVALHALLRRQDLRRSEWDTLLDHFSVQAALITYPELNPRAALFDPQRWALCYRSHEALVFVRRTPAHASLIASDELPVAFQFAPATGSSPIPLAEPPTTSAVQACEWYRRLAVFHAQQSDLPRAAADYRRALREGGDCLPVDTRESTREQAAILELRLGNPERAEELLRGLPSTAARENRAFTLLQLARPDQALLAFEAILRQTPSDPEASFGRALALSKLDRAEAATAALRDFIDRWPQHFAAPQARALLQHQRRPPHP